MMRRGGPPAPRLTVDQSQAIRAGVRSAWPLAAGAVVVGVVGDLPALIPVGVLVGVLALARGLWLRRGLRGFHYQRLVSTRHAVWGDRVSLTVTIWNRWWLPTAWLTADDALSEGIAILAADATDASPGSSVSPAAVGDDITGRRWLRNAWTLWPFERVERRFLIEADRRGRVGFGPVRLATADLFAGTAAQGTLDLPAELTVAPRTLPVRSAGARTRWSAQARAIAGFPEDPAHFAGVRPYLPGDAPRRIHWRATARTGSPRSKRYEASRERELLLVLDIQTVSGWGLGAGYDPELVEALCVASASLARDAITGGSRCGLAAAAYSYRPRAEVHIAPAAGPRQLLTLTDALARLSPFASGRFASLLAGLPRWVAPHTQLVVVTARDPRDELPVLRRLRATGYDVRLVAVGPAGPTIAARAREAGFATQVADLEPDWRTADALALTG